MSEIFCKFKIRSKEKPNLIIEIALIVLFVIFTALRLEGVIRGRLDTELAEDAQTYLKRAEQYYENQKLSRATLNYWYVLKKNPDLVKPHIRISKIFYNKNYWNEDAIVQIERAMKKNPNSAEAHLVKGRLLRDEGLIKEAAEEFERAIELDPDNAEAHYRLGLVYQAEQLFEFAVEQYKLAIETDQELTEPMFADEPFGLQARLRLARIYQQRDSEEFSENIQLLSQIFETEPSSEKLSQITNELLNTYNKSIKLLEEVYKQKPSYTEAKQALIDLLYRKAEALRRIPHLRLYGQTLQLYKRIVEIAPNEADAWKWIGNINYHILENYERALEAYSKAYEIDPNDIEALANIEELKLLIEQGNE